MHLRRKKFRQMFRDTAGFTLTEIVAVLAIIAILAAAVIGVGRYAVKRARVGKATATFEKLSLQIDVYKQDFGMYPPDSRQTENGASLPYCLGLLRANWPGDFTDALGRKRGSSPSPSDYDKPSEILFFFLQEMYDVMNFNYASRQANRALLASLPRTTAYVKFKRNELADTDNDKLPEIVDGWGMPFLYIAADRLRGDSIANIEPHRGKNPTSFSLYSFGPDKLGFYDATMRGESDYPVGDLNFDGKSDSRDQTEMSRRIKRFAQQEGYTEKSAAAVVNRDNLANWEREP